MSAILKLGKRVLPEKTSNEDNETNSNIDSSLQSSIKNFLQRAFNSKNSTKYEPTPKKLKIDNQPNPADSLITSTPKHLSPKPQLTPLKNFAQLRFPGVTEEEGNKENESLQSPTKPRGLDSRTMSLPAIGKKLRRRSLNMDKQHASSQGEDTIFSPMFINRSSSSVGNVMFNADQPLNQSCSAIIGTISDLPSEELPSPFIPSSLLTDEALPLELDIIEPGSESNSSDTDTELGHYIDDSLSDIPLYEEEEEEDATQAALYDPLYLIKALPPVPEHYKNRAALLPPKTKTTPKITLVLDLDETLVHCDLSEVPNPDYVFHVAFQDKLFQIWGRKRPFVDEFLTKVAKLFEVVIFTASQQAYAEHVLDKLDDNGVIDYRLFRDSCVFVEGNYLKDLEALGRDLSKVIIVDNSVTAFGYQLDNGIPVTSWYDDPEDTELRDLFPFLEKLSQVEDVRPYLRKMFKLQEQVDNLPLIL